MDTKPINLVLSGGGARGIAHLGIVQALQENKYEIKGISGTSMGALMGSMLAAKFKPSQILDALENRDILRKINHGIFRSKSGLMTFKPLARFLKRMFPVDDFNQLSIPFYCVSSNLSTGKPELHESGPFLEKVLASSSIPIIFEPIMIDGETHCDGGLFNNMPVDPFINGKYPIFGVNVNSVKYQKEFDGIKEMATRVYQAAIASSVNENKKYCSEYIEIPELRKYGTLDFKDAQEIFQLGYDKTIEYIRKIES